LTLNIHQFLEMASSPPIIKNRILEIVRALYGKGIISEKELSEINPKKDATESFLDNVVSSALFELLTGTSEDSELKVKELSNLVEKVKSDYSKLDEAHIKLSQKQFETEFAYFNKLLLNEIINYVLIHFIKYCNAEIGGSYLHDFKVFLMSQDKNSEILLAGLYQDLTVEEWGSLMDKIQGTRKVQQFLDNLTRLKKTEITKEYNKVHLFNYLRMFRLLKLSSSN